MLRVQRPHLEKPLGCLGLPLNEDPHSCLKASVPACPVEKPFLTSSLSWLT